MSLNTELSTSRKIWSLLTPKERHGAIVLLGLIFLGMLLETLGVGLVVPAIALLTQDNFAQKFPAIQPILAGLGNPDQKTLVIVGMLSLVGIYLVKAIYVAGLISRQTRFAYDLQVRLSQLMFTIYMRQPYTFHLQRNSAILIHNVAGEVSNLIGNAILPGMILITESMVLVGMSVMLLAFEPLGTLVVISILGLAAWSFHRVTRKHISRWGQARHYHEALRSQHLQQGFGGIKDVKLLGREAEFLKQYHVHNLKGANAARSHGVMQQLPRLWLELLAVGGLAILVISMLMQNRSLSAIVPTLGLFAAAAFRLMPSVNRVLNSIQLVRYGTHGIDTLCKELALEDTADAGNGADIHFSSSLELDQISYAYPTSSKSALSDISLVVRRGESVGFIGPSGAGKSTLVDILLGLLKPVIGEVRADGNNIHKNLRSWQNQIGYVPQSIYLTDDTLRRNVAFGLADEQIDDMAVIRAIKAAQLDDFISGLQDGMETLVGERGVRLSGGQRQRIGIARALYHDPQVLVLDEATSALDNETERAVMDAVNALTGEKTILIIAHRLSTVANCDRLYRLDAGKIVEAGTPQTVLIPAVEKEAGLDSF